MNPTTFKQARKPVALAVLGLILLQQANAQTASTDQPAAQNEAAKTDKATPAKQLETVVVSGSRIKRDNYSTSAPLQVIKHDDAVVAGFNSTTQLLQGTAITGGQQQVNNAFGGFVTDGGPGANTIGLRGFAPTRSLVLLNGRRLAPSGTRGSIGAADLNTLPSAIVDRVEVLKDGASSIYGSDAVAGVINIITRKDMDSINIEGSVTRSEEGGGNGHNFALSGGMISDHSRFLASYQYTAQTAMTANQRDWLKCNTDYRRTSDATGVGEWGSRDFIDPLTGKPKCYPISGTGSNGVTINTLGTSSITGVGAAGSVGTRFTRWRPNSSVTTGLVGYEGVGGGANNLNVRDTFEPRMLNRTIMSPVQNHNFYAQGGLDLPSMGDGELYYEVMFNRRESQQVGYRQLTVDYAKGSPLIPAGLAASTFSGPTNISNGSNVGVRAFIGFGNDHSSQSVNFGRAVVGLRGGLFDWGWDYDVSLSHSDSRGSYTSESFLTDKLAQSLNVVAGANGITCKDTSGGCVAAPAVSSALLGGQIPAAWGAYIFRPVTGVAKYNEDVLTASVTGPILSLPYGKLKGAFGVEVRRNSIDDTPPEDSQNGNLFNLTSAAPTRGSDQAKDVFGELEVPLLKGLPGAHELTMSVSGRVADYRSYGTGSTYKFGGVWAPVDWISVRGTHGTSYRAPALYEQFLGATSGFLSQQLDPCNNWDAPANSGTNRAANCKSEGLPAGFVATSGITVLNAGGRAAGLKAETSKNSTVGLILQPSMPAGWGDFSLAVDRFDITVDNGVSRAGTANILQRCYDDPGFRAAGGFCRLISARDSSSNALTVSDSYINLATDIVRGFDYTARYTNDIGLGKLRVNLQITEYTSQANKLFADDQLRQFTGTLQAPRMSGALDVNYKVKDWTFYYGMEWIGKMNSYDYLGEDPATSTFKLNTPSYITHAMSLTYEDTVGKWKATLGVRNLTNTALPQISAQAGYNKIGNAPLYSGYDYVGRKYFMNVSKTF